VNPLTYTLHHDAAVLLDSGAIGHLAGKYLTAQRLEHAAFAITAEQGGTAAGLIIAELPWGPIGDSWERHVTDPVELGALFVDDRWRGTPVAYRLMTLALDAAARLGRTPVAATETGSAVHHALARMGAEPRTAYMAGGVEYTPWILTPAPVPAAA
jgi:GNAT superfamily N-acetyltransferase